LCSRIHHRAVKGEIGNKDAIVTGESKTIVG
jgi:hypothetical protein